MARRKRRRQKKITFRITLSQAIVFGVVVFCLLSGIHLGFQGELGDSPTWDDWYAALGLSSTPASTNTVSEETQAVHFIDVGQADATLLQSGDEYCLVDAGEADSETELLRYLDQQGITKLKLLVMSHPHADHIGSMKAVLEHVTVEQVLLPDFDKAPYPTTRTFERVMDTIEAQQIPTITAQTGQSFTIGEATLTVVADGVETDNYNNLSQVLFYDAPGITVLLSGDGEKEVEQAALEQGNVPKADVFKAAHHGSNTSNTRAFLQAISPRYVVVSCGKDNSYGHPHKEPMQRYQDIGAEVLRTDQDGSVVITATEAGLQYYTANAQSAAA